VTDIGRPYVLVSCAVSLDGYLDDARAERLLLSNDEDFDRVDAIRAGCDAILVGAATIRADDPRLLVRSAARREERLRRGTTATPVKVTLTRSGDLDPAARFFTAGEITKLVYAPAEAVARLRGRLGAAADVLPLPPADDPLPAVLADLRGRGVGRLMVEGGGDVLTGFLTGGLVDELRLAVAPFLVGDRRAPRFVRDGRFPWAPEHRARLAEVEKLGDVAVLRYLAT
jgi:5-amino-6-(5-phosphoribosylamino)uracil reductase